MKLTCLNSMIVGLLMVNSGVVHGGASPPANATVSIKSKVVQTRPRRQMESSIGAVYSTLRKYGKRVPIIDKMIEDIDDLVRQAKDIEQRFCAGAINRQQRELEHARNAAGFAGRWGGVGVGAFGGSKLAPGSGTLAGGIAGYHVGGHVARSAAEWAVETVHASGNTFSDLAQSTAQTISQTAESIGKNVSDTAQSAGTAISQGAQSVGKYTSETTQAAGKVISQAAQSAANCVSNSAQSAGTAISETAQSASTTVSETAQAAWGATRGGAIRAWNWIRGR